MKYNKLFILTLISIMSVAALMFAGCDDKKSTAENTKVEKTDKKTTDSSNEGSNDSSDNTSSETEDKYQYDENGYRIVSDNDPISMTHLEDGQQVLKDDGYYYIYHADGDYFSGVQADDYVDPSTYAGVKTQVPQEELPGNYEAKIAYNEQVERWRELGLCE